MHLLISVAVDVGGLCRRIPQAAASAPAPCVCAGAPHAGAWAGMIRERACTEVRLRREVVRDPERSGRFLFRLDFRNGTRRRPGDAGPERGGEMRHGTPIGGIALAG